MKNVDDFLEIMIRVGGIVTAFLVRGCFKKEMYVCNNDICFHETFMKR